MTKNNHIEHGVATYLALSSPKDFKYDDYGQLTFIKDSTVYYIDVIATEAV